MSFLSDERRRLSSSLLDSSLKSRTIPKTIYNCKVIECGNYKQFYIYDTTYSRQSNEWTTPLSCTDIYDAPNNIYVNIEDNLFSSDTVINKEPSLKQIELRNLIRSNNNLCRLIRTNETIFKTFITLTFSDNITDIKSANYEFNNCMHKIKRVFPSLSYIAVPEYQQNDRIHYHLLTNIEYSNNILINENIQLLKLYHNFNLKFNNLKLHCTRHFSFSNLQFEKMNDFPICFRYQFGKLHNTKKTWNYKTRSFKVFKTLKYWNEGFTNVIQIDNNITDITRYMAKYMTKDHDNRLYGKKRYLFSRNLTRPVETLLDTKQSSDAWLLYTYLNTENISYQKNYKDKFGQQIILIETKIKEDI